MDEFTQNSVVRYILLGIFVVFVLNAIVIDILFFASRQKNSDNLVLQRVSAICPQSCVAQFSQITQPQQASKSSSTTASVATELTPTPTVTPTSTPIPTVTSTPTPTLREYFIPLGQGNGSYTDWTVVPGMGAKITVANYGKIEKVYFEATVRVPGSQTVSIRLYNASSQQNIANSELAPSSGTATLLTSPAISLTNTKDENLYQVQLNTQLGSTVYIDQARLRILSR